MRADVSFLVILGITCVALPAPAQRVQISGPPVETTAKAQALTNADVISMAVAGLDESIIIDKIRSSASRSFDTSVEGLKSLRAANVSNGVIREMMTGKVSAEAAASSNDPSVIHQPGVYVMVFNHDGATKLMMLEHTRALGDQVSGGHVVPLPIGGFSTKKHSKQELNGPKSPVQLDDANPTFYIYIPEDTQSFGGSDMSARDFELIKLKERDRTREVETSAVSMSGAGTVSGVQDKMRQNTTVSKLKPGVYMVKMTKPLKPGEYAFQHELDGIYYDFGIRDAK